MRTERYVPHVIHGRVKKLSRKPQVERLAQSEPGRAFPHRMSTWKATMARTERVMMIATRLADASSRASGISSENTIQIMAPAANPSPKGNKGLNVSTNMKAGTAIRGCGRLEKTLQRAALLHLTALGTSTWLMARTSG